MARSGPVTKDTSTVALGLAQVRIGNSAASIANIAPVLSSTDSIGALASTKYSGNVDFWKLESGFPLLEDLTIPLRESAQLECEFKEISSYNLALARGIDPSAGAGTYSVVNPRVITSTNTLVVVPANFTIASQTYIQAGSYTIQFTSATAYNVTHDTQGLMGDDGGVTVGSSEGFDFDGSNDAVTLTANFVTGTIATGDVLRFDVSNVASDYTDVHAGEIKLGEMTSPAYVRMEAVYTYPNGTNHMYIIFPRANVVSSVELDLQAEDNAAVAITIEAKRGDSEVSGGNAAWDDKTLGRILFD